MAGTLTISTLSDGTNSTSSTNPIRGSAKAWAVFNGTAGTLTTSYNVSSITKNSTANYTINITNALTDANYSVVGSTVGNTTSYYTTMVTSQQVANTSSAFKVQIRGVDTSTYDCNYVSVACFR